MDTPLKHLSMDWSTPISLSLGCLLFWWGMHLGRTLLRQGVTPNDLFKGKNTLAVGFVVLYLGFVVIALNVPQMAIFPLEWRALGMQITWTILRVVLMGVCGIGFTIAWKTAKIQAIVVILVGLLGISTFSTAEAYFLAPIYPMLYDNLQANGVFKQSFPSSCAPAALATILQLWGIPATESSVAKAAETSRLGTSMPQLVLASRKLGMEAVELQPTWAQMRQMNRPGILSVWLFNRLGKAPHAVALVGIGKTEAVIADPARGKLFVLDQNQFKKVWRGEYLPIFRPTDTIITRTQAVEYLTGLGYSGVDVESLPKAIARFQQSMGIPETGSLDPTTVLFLQGPFLESVPTLNLPDLSLK